MANEKQTGTEKLLTLANLAKYNHKVCEMLGLEQDNFGYAYDGYSFTKVNGALDTLFEKVDSITGGTATVKSGDNTLATIGIVSGTAKPSIELALTNNLDGTDETLLTNTAIATKEYVDAKAAAEATVYSFGDDATFSKVAGEEKYKVTVPLMKKVGNGAETQADTIDLTFDSSEFVKDSFLQDAKMGEGDDANYLILTMKLAEADAEGNTTKDIKVNLAQFITAYNGGKGIDITDYKISVDVAADGYLGFTADTDAGKLTILDSKLAKGTTKDGAAATNLATQGYVDDATEEKTVTVEATYVSEFGTEGSIDVKQNGVSVGTFTVALPALSAVSGESDSQNVQVELVEGTISVTTNETGGTGDYAELKALAQQGYVDEKIASISVVDGANIVTDATDQQSANGIYVTVTGNTFTVGAVVATDTEIEGIFGTHA